MNQMLTLTHATERDIDLLLVEEIKTSRAFVSWMMKELGLDHLPEPRATVFHSVRRMHSRREIDISVQVWAGGQKLLLLVENKLDTDEQAQQAESYYEEAQAHQQNYDLVQTVLTCPANYLPGHKKFADAFDYVLRYEAVAEFLEQRSTSVGGEIGDRCAHRASLIRQAIGKQRRGYVQVVHPGKLAFSSPYVELVGNLAPRLIPGPSMLRESAAESVTMIFAPSTLPKWHFLPNTRLVHQLRAANANINFYRWGDYFEELADEMEPSLQGTGFRLVPSVNKRPNGRSGLMVMADTPQVDQMGDFEAQSEAIKTGIVETERLLDWFIASQKKLERCSKIVSELDGQAF